MILVTLPMVLGMANEPGRSRFSQTRPGLVAADALAWLGALSVAMAVRIDGGMNGWDDWHLVGATVVAAGTHLAIGRNVGLYRGRWPQLSLDESVAICVTVVTSTIVLAIASEILPGPRLLPASVALGAAPAAVVYCLANRLVGRSQATGKLSRSGEGLRVLVVGAGDGGTQLVRSMFNDAEQRWLPVALIDDDPNKRSLRIEGVRVMGTRNDLEAVSEFIKAELIVVSASSMAPATLRDLSRRALRLDIPMSVIPRAATGARSAACLQSGKMSEQPTA